MCNTYSDFVLGSKNASHEDSDNEEDSEDEDSDSETQRGGGVRRRLLQTVDVKEVSAEYMDEDEEGEDDEDVEEEVEVVEEEEDKEEDNESETEKESEDEESREKVVTTKGKKRAAEEPPTKGSAKKTVRTEPSETQVCCSM